MPTVVIKERMAMLARCRELLRVAFGESAADAIDAVESKSEQLAGIAYDVEHGVTKRADGLEHLAELTSIKADGASPRVVAMKLVEAATPFVAQVAREGKPEYHDALREALEELAGFLPSKFDIVCNRMADAIEAAASPFGDMTRCHGSRDGFNVIDYPEFIRQTIERQKSIPYEFSSVFAGSWLGRHTAMFPEMGWEKPVAKIYQQLVHILRSHDARTLVKLMLPDTKQVRGLYVKIAGLPFRMIVNYHVMYNSYICTLDIGVDGKGGNLADGESCEHMIERL